MTKNIKRTYKDSVFRSLFNEEAQLSELYSTISGKAVGRESINIVTLENAVFNGIKNDLAFTVDSKLVVMIEHQSTDNPNMPLRMLRYLGEIYELVLGDSNLYGSKQIKIPVPELYVFYNGSTKREEEWMQKLSDSFKEKAEFQFVEVMVKVININYIKGAELLRKCRPLEGYSILIHKVQTYYQESQDLDYAMRRAIKECIEEGILVEFLRKNRGNIMSILNFTLTTEQMKEISYNEGLEQGMETAQEKIARNMKADGISVETIMKYTSLPRGRIEAV